MKNRTDLCASQTDSAMISHLLISLLLTKSLELNKKSFLHKLILIIENALTISSSKSKNIAIKLLVFTQYK